MKLRALFIATCLATACVQMSCTSTVVPKPITSSQASWDGGAQTSGVLFLDANSNAVVTPHWRDRYNLMIGDYGNQFLPPLHKDDGLSLGPLPGTFQVDPEHLRKFIQMNGWRKQGKTTL